MYSLTVDVSFSGYALHITNICFSPNIDIKSVITNISCFDFGGSWVLSGDFNSWYISWRYNFNDARVAAVLDFTFSKDLLLVHKPALCPFFFSHSGSGNPDITFVSSDLYQYADDWLISEEDSGASDHLYVCLGLSFSDGSHDDFVYISNYCLN